VEDHQVNGFMQIFGESSFRFTDNGSILPLPIMADTGFDLFHTVGARTEEKKSQSCTVCKEFLCDSVPLH